MPTHPGTYESVAFARRLRALRTAATNIGRLDQAAKIRSELQSVVVALDAALDAVEPSGTLGGR